MSTALQDTDWFGSNLDGLPTRNIPWLEKTVRSWKKDLSAKERERRLKFSAPPREEQPISDDQIDRLMDQVFNPSPMINPRWANDPRAIGFLFQRQIEIILMYDGYEAHSDRPVGRDGGIDVEAIGPEGQSIIIQVKKYGQPVQKPVVQRWHQQMMNTSFGFVLPELWFVAPAVTDGSREYCRDNQTTLVEEEGLRTLLARALRNGMDPDELLTANPMERLVRD